MNRNSDFSIPSNDGRFSPRRRSVGVHTLSEFVFCPRAGVLASESQREDDGEEDVALGPKLSGFFDYDERIFAERSAAELSRGKKWLTLLAPCMLLIFVVWRLASPFAAIVASLPSVYVLAGLLDVVRALAILWREQAVFKVAPTAAVDMNPNQICEINWWTLRKAGFDCTRPRDAYVDEELKGRPWRPQASELTATVGTRFIRLPTFASLDFMVISSQFPFSSMNCSLNRFPIPASVEKQGSRNSSTRLSEFRNHPVQ